MTPQVKPLSYKHRNLFFYLLMAAFFLSLPFLFLYATGYRFYFGESVWVSTGGLYIAAERTGAEIYIDDQLVRETRVFRRAFYAQGLNAGTHKVHVQKEGHHTWVKELPVYPHLVTEAQAFNLPLVPEIRVVTPWQTKAGVAVLTASSSILTDSKVTNQYLFEPNASTSTLVKNPEFDSILDYFAPATTTPLTTADTVAKKVTEVIKDSKLGGDTEIATTTKTAKGVRLYQEGEEVYAKFVGPAEEMPYYYCAPDFLPYQSATSTAAVSLSMTAVAKAAADPRDELMMEVNKITPETECDPAIRIDRDNEEVSYFDFFPGSGDLVLMGEESGVYVSEIDDRSWQNRQPLITGSRLAVRVINGAVYVYDGDIIYQVQIDQSWF